MEVVERALYLEVDHVIRSYDGVTPLARRRNEARANLGELLAVVGDFDLGPRGIDGREGSLDATGSTQIVERVQALSKYSENIRIEFA